jgi:hypothetical protein
MTSEEELLDLIADGRRLLGRERTACLEGRLDELGRLGAEKQGLLERLEAAIPGAPGTPAVRRALAGLIEAGRHNERVLAGARAGVAAARRRLEAIAAARRGDVAYAEDGSRIVSRDDAAGRTSRA